MARVKQPDVTIPKEFLQEDNVYFFKAFFVKPDERDKKLDIHKEGDIYFLTRHNAVEDIINQDKINIFDDIVSDTVVVMIVLAIPKDEIDLDELRLGIDLKSINVAMKEYKHTDIKIEEYYIKDCVIKIDKSGIRTLEELIMNKI